MKHFITKLSLFFLFWFFLVVGTTFLNSFLFTKIHNELYSGKTTLIIGDSGVKELNEKIIPNSFNLADDMESYKVMYHKMVYFTRTNKIDQVILPISYHNFTYLPNFNNNYDYTTIYRIYPIASPATMFKTTKNYKNWVKVLSRYVCTINFEYLLKYLSVTELDKEMPIEQGITYEKMATLENGNVASKYSNVSFDKRMDYINMRANKQFHFHGKEEFFSELDFDYLKGMIEICKEKKIKLLLCSMPLDPLYKEKIPDFYKNKLDEILDYVRTYEHVTYINFMDQYDDNLSMMRNQDHCNKYGAALISDIIVEQYLHQ